MPRLSEIENPWEFVKRSPNEFGPQISDLEAIAIIEKGIGKQYQILPDWGSRLYRGVEVHDIQAAAGPKTVATFYKYVMERIQLIVSDFEPKSEQIRDIAPLPGNSYSIIVTHFLLRRDLFPLSCL